MLGKYEDPHNLVIGVLLSVSDWGLEVRIAVKWSFVQVNGSPQDYSTYLVDRGSSDILFPTDFQLLQALYKRLAGKSSHSCQTPGENPAT